ncbi:MAG: hydantoinase/oxoprolinase family protein [Fuerstiella sp.]
MNVLGLDIGGANIKASDADGRTASKPFAMWIRHAELCDVLQEWAANDLSAAGMLPADMVALTMTAELADCFETKQQGVEFIVRAVEQAFPDLPVQVWMTSGEFADPDDAVMLTPLVAASNWHALATWAGRAIPNGPAVLIDVGSTTTDIIPLLDGQPVSQGLNDFERLCAGELVYTGVGRTPVCAIVQSVPIADQQCPIAAELFATSIDAYVIAEQVPEDPNCNDTADSRPLTREHSLNRLAHMLCCDASEIAEADVKLIAEHIIAVQVNSVAAAFERTLQHLDSLMQQEGGRSLSAEPATVILSGSGAILGLLVIKQLGPQRFANCLNLPDMFYRPISAAACAFAVARLAHDRCQDDMLETSLF